MNARYRFWMNVAAGALVPLVCAVALGMVYVATHLADEEGGR